MKGAGVTGQRLVAIFAMGAMLLNYPILSLFAGGADRFGIPLLYTYVFVVWTAVIGLMALVIELPRD
jgi:hypothetical protein